MVTDLIMCSYSLSLPLDSFHLLNITEASTLAGLKVLGSLRRLTTESKIVLRKKTVGNVGKKPTKQIVICLLKYLTF